MIDISIDTDCQMTDIDVQSAVRLINNAAECALSYMKRRGDVNITLTDNAKIREINAQFRNIDRATDVLSFPAQDGSAYDITDGFLGDIAVSLERANEQANEYGHSLTRELCFLTIHGMLHIMGYDHVTPEQEREMFGLQDNILEYMGVTK